VTVDDFQSIALIMVAVASILNSVAMALHLMDHRKAS
jgi:hypothetical protein